MKDEIIPFTQSYLDIKEKLYNKCCARIREHIDIFLYDSEYNNEDFRKYLNRHSASQFSELIEEKMDKKEIGNNGLNIMFETNVYILSPQEMIEYLIEFGYNLIQELSEKD